MLRSTLANPFHIKSSLKPSIWWALVAGIIMALVTLSMPNYYKSEARMLPVDTKGTGGNFGGLASAAAALGVNVPGGDSSDANFVDVLSSRWLQEQLLHTEFTYHLRKWRFGDERIVKGNLYDYIGAKNIDQALKELSTIVSASRDQKSKIISISAETKSPELAQLIVDRSYKLLENFLQDKGRTRGGAKATFAEARLLEARREMDFSEGNLLRFLQGNRNYQSSSDPGVRLKGNRLEAELRLRQQLVSTLALNREQALLEEKNDIPILNLLDSANLPIDKTKPARFLMVLLAMAVSGLACWIYLNWEWIRSALVSEKVEFE